MFLVGIKTNGSYEFLKHWKEESKSFDPTLKALQIRMNCFWIKYILKGSLTGNLPDQSGR